MPRHQNTVSRIPVPVPKTVAPPEKKKKRKSTLFAPTCSRMAREADNFNDRTTKRANRTTGLPKKAPVSTKQNKVEHLKNDYLQLKNKICKDEKVILKQAEEITRLKKWMTNTLHRIEIAEKETNLETRKKELELELEKVRLEKQMSVAVQTETHHASLEDEMNKLKKQLEIQETNHNLKLAEYAKLLCTKDDQIHQQQMKYNRAQQKHAKTIQQLNAFHIKTMNSIENDTLENQLERILIEFEQEQHHHPVVSKQEISCMNKKSVGYNINQQWWSKQFMPTDAASWPSPQPLSNLRKPIVDKRYCI